MAGNPAVQDIMRRFYPKYLEKYTFNVRQAKAAVYILNCKTGSYGEGQRFQMQPVWPYPVFNPTDIDYSTIPEEMYQKFQEQYDWNAIKRPSLLRKNTFM